MIPTGMSARSYSWAVLYDSDCGFCRWSLALVLRADRRRLLYPVRLDSSEAGALLGPMPEETRYASSHLVAPGGDVWSGGRAIAPLFELLPGGSVVSLLPKA